MRPQRTTIVILTALFSILLSGCFVQKTAHYGKTSWFENLVGNEVTRITFGYQASKEFSALRAFCAQKAREQNEFNIVGWADLKECVFIALNTPEFTKFKDDELRSIMAKAAIELDGNRAKGAIDLDGNVNPKPNNMLSALKERKWGQCLQLHYWSPKKERPNIHFTLVEQGGQCFRRSSMIQ